MTRRPRIVGDGIAKSGRASSTPSQPQSETHVAVSNRGLPHLPKRAIGSQASSSMLQSKRLDAVRQRNKWKPAGPLGPLREHAVWLKQLYTRRSGAEPPPSPGFDIVIDALEELARRSASRSTHP